MDHKNLILVGRPFVDQHPSTIEHLSKSAAVIVFQPFDIAELIRDHAGKTFDVALGYVAWTDMFIAHATFFALHEIQIKHLAFEESAQVITPAKTRDLLGICVTLPIDSTDSDWARAVAMCCTSCEAHDPEVEFVMRVLAKPDPLENPVFDELDHSIARLAFEGLTNDEIASTVHYSHQTVRNRMSEILRVTGAHNRTELAFMWRRHAMLQPFRDRYPK